MMRPSHPSDTARVAWACGCMAKAEMGDGTRTDAGHWPERQCLRCSGTKPGDLRHDGRGVAAL